MIRTWSFSGQIRIEASSLCQLKCPSCPTANQAILPTIGKGFLQLSDFCRLVDANPWIKKIEISNYGEIFLNPDLLEIMKYAHKKKVILTAQNGVNLNNAEEKVLEGLARYKFGCLSCSIDGTDRDTYAKYRVGGNYDAVIQNIGMINTFKKKFNTQYPVLSWQFILFGHNESELLKAKLFAKRLNMHFFPKLSWDDELSPLVSDFAKKEFGVASRQEYKMKYGKNYMQPICHQLWDEPQINWDGKLLGCCRNFWGDFGGNIFKDGLIETLNNEKINYAKGMLIGMNERRADIPCTTCDVYLDMKSNSKWLDRSFKQVLMNKLINNIPFQVKPVIQKLKRRKRLFTQRLLR